MKILFIYPVACEYAYPEYLDKKLDPDLFDREIMANTDLDVRYLTGFQELKHECVLFYPRRNNVTIKEFRHRGGYRMIRFPITFFEGKIGMEFPFKMIRFIKKEKPDIVQYIGGWEGGKIYYFRFFNWVALYCWLNRIPCIPFYHVGGLKAGKKARFIRNIPVLKQIEIFFRSWSFKISPGITFINHVGYERMYNPNHPEYYGIDFSKVPAKLQFNTYNPEHFFPVPREEAVRKAGLDPAKKYLIMVSRLFREKGLHIIVHLMPRLLERFPDIHLLVVGDFIEEARDYRNELMNFIEKNNLADKISFLGRLEHHQGLVYYINSSEAFILPTYKDTFAAVNIEALACEIPVITTNKDEEIPYYLEPEVGFCIEHYDQEALYNACVKILCGQFIFDKEKNREILAKYNYKTASAEMIDWFKHLRKH
ncbi:MAG: glycosyltransferase family 4 protein [Bacteroidales bacterium]|jgi:glycosyltransferase involved in cell wall biosynthesis